MSTAFVLGNGTSRQGIALESLRDYGKIYACNAVFREFDPDYLVAVDAKMIFEICKANYQHKVPVWTNENRAFKKFKNLNYFSPPLGWSSGPTALHLATKHTHTKLYLLGWDFVGTREGKLNNLFADTQNYKKSTDEATFYGNWMNQTKRCLSDFKQVKFYRVIPKGWFKPNYQDRAGVLSGNLPQDA